MDKHKCKYIYALICILMFSIIYFPIVIKGKMYMYLDIGADTYCSYWPSMVYASSLFDNFKLWDTSLGLGASTMIQVSYFLADPFNLVIYPFSAYNMDIGIFISLFLKYLVLACFAFKYFQKMQLYGLAQIIASTCVVFSGYFVGWGQHYNYASMFCVFMMLLYFFEQWIQDEKWLGFVLVLSLHAVTMPYFCYMTLIFLAVYYLIRGTKLCWINQKQFLIHGTKTVGLCLVGIGISSIVFIPTVFDIISSPRVNGKMKFGFLPGTLKEYISLILRSFSNNILGINQYQGYANWYESPFIYVGLIVFFLFPFFIKKNGVERKVQVSLVIVCISLLFLHSTALLFNAFSAISYRWTYILIPLMGLVIGNGVLVLEEAPMNDLKKKVTCVYIGILIILTFYLFLLFNNINYEYDKEIIWSVIIVFIVATAYLIIPRIEWKNRKLLIMAIMFVSVFELTVNGVISVRDRSLISRESKKEMGYFDETSKLIQQIKEQDSEFYRINKKYSSIDLNDSMIQNYNGEKLYSSILNESYWNLQNMFNLRVKNSNYFYGFDDKQSLRNINAGKYMLSADKREYYGYDLLKSEGNKNLYINKNNIGFGFSYTKVMNRSEFEKLDALEKQNVIYDICIIEDNDKEIFKDLEHVFSSKYTELREVDFQLNVTENGTEIMLASQNSKPLVLKIENPSSQPIDLYGYTAVQGEEYSNSDIFNMSINSLDEAYYNLDVLNLNRILMCGSKDYEVSLYEMEMKNIESLIEEKRSNGFKLNYWNDECYKGFINSKSKALLYLPIVYDKNWKIYVNGSQVPLFRVNGGGVAVLIDEGESNVEILYVSKAFIIGRIVSICTIIIVVGVYVYGRESKKRN